MAPSAVSRSAGLKLTGMNILVAGGTGRCKPGKLPLNCSGRFILKMTVTAGFGRVCPGQLKTGLCMIEANCVPPVHGMANPAILTRVILFRKAGLMNVLMTIDTFSACNKEIPFPRFLMTGDAGSRKVSSFKPEGSQVMTLCRKGRFCKAIDRMAGRTIGRDALLCKLAGVIIRMAICTAGIFQLIGVSRFVTPLAINGLVPSLKPEMGLVMIEAADAFDHRERDIRVTLGAILTEFILMRILVTG